MGNMELACPRPLHPMMRMGAGDIQTSRPFRKLTSCASLLVEGEPGHEILEILLDKACLWDVGGSPIGFIPFSWGSPPVRASNPLIHDKSPMLGEYPLLPRNHSQMEGTASNAAFVDTSKLRARKLRVLSQEALRLL
ncbi:hypothetical protein GOP47_0014807 [Adiantum capillus-veneris]|uniref:Uncharacterized protein n=1 Tax=Adiantum capillus-veneris TaxID=13818 RepID=A0A9D4ZCU2_ADICA|nr:hypothetical protein GOP47_0014807 [Adiantum capillus-veneris]